jgi:prefoldin subunit 5
MRISDPGSVFSTELLDTTRQKVPEVAALEAQIAHLKQLVALLQAQIADMGEQKDKWQSRAERISLVSQY